MPILPQFQGFSSKDFQLMQNTWGAILNKILRLSITQGVQLEEVSLTTGVNVINHKLGRKLHGWIITDTQGTATVYRSAPKSEVTLTLTASAPVIVDIYVF